MEPIEVDVAKGLVSAYDTYLKGATGKTKLVDGSTIYRLTCESDVRGVEPKITFYVQEVQMDGTLIQYIDVPYVTGVFVTDSLVVTSDAASIRINFADAYKRDIRVTTFPKIITQDDTDIVIPDDE